MRLLEDYLNCFTLTFQSTNWHTSSITLYRPRSTLLVIQQSGRLRQLQSYLNLIAAIIGWKYALLSQKL
jgi:hypothetical protein